MKIEKNLLAVRLMDDISRLIYNPNSIHSRAVRQDIARILRDEIAIWADLTDCCSVPTNLLPPTTIACSKCGAIVRDG